MFNRLIMARGIRIRALISFAWVSALGVLSACVKDIAIEVVPEPPRLAIYSILQPDSLVSVWISQTKSVIDRHPFQAVTNATVIISADNGLTQTLNLVDADRGRYQADFIPQPEVTYRLSVTAEGYPPVEAITTVPSLVSLDNVDYRIIPANKPTDCAEAGACADTVTRYTFALTFSDPVSTRNYYRVSSSLKYRSETSNLESSGGETATVWDTLTTTANNNSVDPVLEGLEALTIDEPYEKYRDYYFTDQLFNGQEYTFAYTSEVEEAFPLSMNITLTQYHKAGYHYLQSIALQEELGDIFSELIPLAQNIQGGYGIFSSFSQDRIVIKLD